MSKLQKNQPKQTKSQRQATDHAAEDIVRLFSGDLSDRDHQALMDWKTRSQDYQDSFNDTVQALADFERLEDDPDLRALISGSSTPESPAFRSRSWPALAMAATVLIGVCFFTYHWLSPVPGESSAVQRYVTRIGEQKVVNLSDGSTVTLNTGTELLVTVTETSRKVILSRGEAYFDIAKDPLRPFSVDVGVRTISVLGTEFNLQRTPQQITLAVVDGVVAIHREDEAVSMNTQQLKVPAGDTVQVIDGRQRRIHAGTVAEFDTQEQRLVGYKVQDISDFHEWRTGVLRFDAEPLHKVVRELNRYSAKKILIEDPSIMDLRLYASVHIARIDTALLVLEQTLPVKVSQKFDRIVLEQK